MKAKILIGFLAVFIISLLIANTTSTSAQTQVLKSLENDISTLVESIKPSLVTIQTKRVKPLPPGSYRGTFRMEELIGVGPILVGSGIVYDKEGHILTTTSVIGRKHNFSVTLSNGDEVEGKLVGIDPEHNLAVLKVDAKNLTPAKLGNSDKLKVGSWLTIVGNSYGLPSAVALGVMNGQRKDGFIQMSANVSPGNSGGPVLNTKGEVVGLVSAKVTEPSYISNIEIFRSQSESIFVSPGQLDLPTSGVSLAIPINEVRDKADYIIKHGTIKRGYLGVYIDNLDKNELEKYGIENGVMIDGVVDDTPADEGGLEDGDIVLFFNGKKVEGSSHFSKMIKKTRPETEVKLKILRDSKKETIKVTIGEAQTVFGGLEALGSLRALESLKALKNLKEIEADKFQESYQKAQGKYEEKMKKAQKKLEKTLEKLGKRLERLNQRLEKLERSD